MPYFVILLASILFALIAIAWWVGLRYPSKKTVERTHEKARQLLALGDFDQAKKALNKLLSRPNVDPHTIALYAESLRGTKQLTAARALIENALQRFKNHAGLERELGRILLEQQEPEKALFYLAKHRKVLKREAERLDLATALFLTGDIEAAWQSIENDITQSVNGQLLALAADCQFHNKNYELAIKLYTRAAEYGWTNYNTLTRVGHSLRCQGELLEAERYFRRILAYDSGDISATLGLGTCLEARQLYHRALIVYQSGGAWDLGDPRILRQAGICAAHTHKHDYAELYLKEAIERGAGSPQALAFLGYSYEAQEKWEEAEDCYLNLSVRFPHHVAGYRALAWLYGVGLSQTLSAEEGLFMAQQALQILPDPSAWELLSACEARAGNYSKAHEIQEQLSQATEDQPTRLRHRHAMRHLRQQKPLNTAHLPRELVA